MGLDDYDLSKKKKIKISAIACMVSMTIALIANGTIVDKLLWFVELSAFSLVVIWTIW